MELALSIASITYGGLLGTYIMTGVVRRSEQPDAVAAIVVATVAMLVIVFVKPGEFAADLAWPWYVPLGTAITLVVGFTSSRIRQAVSSA